MYSIGSRLTTTIHGQNFYSGNSLLLSYVHNLFSKSNIMRKLLLASILVFFILSIILFKGKAYTRDQQWHLSGPPGGVVTEIAICKDNPSAIVSASFVPFPGLLKSIDGGESWELLNGGLEFLLPEAISHDTAIYSFAIDAVFPDTMFIGIRSSYTDFGFYKSYDGGRNWQLVMENEIVRAISANNGLVYASPESGGLLVSYDGGETWQHIAQSCPTANRIVFDPQFPDTLYAGTNGHGLYKIYHFSSDVSAYRLVAFPDTTIAALDVFSSDTSCAVVVGIGSMFYESSVCISLDRGESWITRDDGLQLEDPLNCIGALAISPDDPSIIYAGTCYGMYKTLDQGCNWFSINEGLEIPTTLFPESEDVYVLALAIDQNNPDIVYAGTDGMGLFKTSNGGGQWSLIGIPVPLVLGLSVSPLNSDLVYAGAYVGFYVRRNNNWNPTTLWGGLTSGIKSIASSPIDSNLVIASYNNAIFTPLLYKSTDGGNNWEMTRMLWEDSDVLDIIFDPVFPERVYAIWCNWLSNNGGFLISNNSGDSWSISQIDSLELSAPFNAVISPLAINPENTTELYLLDIYGEVYRSTDRALTWTKIRTETDTAHYAIAIDPFHPEDIYLGTRGVWKSSDSGDTWLKIGPDEWIHDMAFDENTGYLYVATFGSGVFFTTDGGETWDSLPTPPDPYLRVIDIGEKVDQSIIYIGTYGAGVFEWREDVTPVAPFEIDSQQSSRYAILQNYPNPFNDKTLIEFEVLSPGQVTLRIINILGQTVRTLVNEYKSAGQYSISWDGKINSNKEAASGIYFLHLQYGDVSEATKLLLIK